MSTFALLAIAGLIAALLAVILIVRGNQTTGNAVIAAMLSAGFAAFTAATIWHEGVMTVVANHTANLWGVQVWWDLLFSLTVALFFVLPRARAAGMNIPLWTLFVVATASIGLLAMIARLFWLEHRTAAKG